MTVLNQGRASGPILDQVIPVTGCSDSSRLTPLLGPVDASHVIATFGAPDADGTTTILGRTDASHLIPVFGR
ncbi:MAG TPA: hypothetical protein VHW44_18790 [Pseudonocardiaceae bacterium]|nr:hypothetical protein [Pseudonocardiaceae bacterium]